MGYYAISAGSVSREGASERVGKGAGRHPIPVLVLTRLGVDVSEQGRGLGSALIRDAFLQTASVAERVGVRALLIHAETEQAVQFYTGIDPGFERSPTDSLHVLLLMKDLRSAIGGNASKDKPVVSRG